MARVRPFAAWRYASSETDITPLTAPPYDVISPEQRARLIALSEHNVVALELPEGPLDPTIPGNRYENGAATWDAWRTDGTLVQDSVPAFYVLEQAYTLGGAEVRRRAIIGETALEPFDAGIVLPHERTLPKALGDRFELTRATRANLSQVFGLFDDPANETGAVFEQVMSGNPVATSTDADGVTSTLWMSTDSALATRLADFFSDRRIFIADGHHRYTTALAYRDECRAKAETAGTSQADPAYDFVMMALVNMDDPDLVVLPTHRVADAQGDFDASEFKSRLSETFEITEIGDADPQSVLREVEGPAFVMLASGDSTPSLVHLRSGLDIEHAIPLDHSLAWKTLDVAVLQELVLWPLLAIHPDHPETLDRLSFVKDARLALESVPEHDVAFLLRATRMNQLRDVALAGETMPQKSTYFYPKLLSGLVFRSAE